MCQFLTQSILAGVLLIAATASGAQSGATKIASANASPVLVELFTSEGCSSCPPADEILRQIAGKSTPEGQLVIGISEHVDYWDRQGWKDPFSSELYTRRQNEYSERFGLDTVYTPQMVINGREQFPGIDRRALVTAFESESHRNQIALHITAAQVSGNSLSFSYSAADLPSKGRLQLFAVLVDDTDRSSVLRGENSGKALVHASVARLFTELGTLHQTEQRSVNLPLPPNFTYGSWTGHHLILFAQQAETGAVVGADTRPI